LRAQKKEKEGTCLLRKRSIQKAERNRVLHQRGDHQSQKDRQLVDPLPPSDGPIGDGPIPGSGEMSHEEHVFQEGVKKEGNSQEKRKQQQTEEYRLLA
jgi:hypothetical protein